MNEGRGGREGRGEGTVRRGEWRGGVSGRRRVGECYCEGKGAGDVNKERGEGGDVDGRRG